MCALKPPLSPLPPPPPLSVSPDIAEACEEVQGLRKDGRLACCQHHLQLRKCDPIILAITFDKLVDVWWCIWWKWSTRHSLRYVRVTLLPIWPKYHGLNF